MNHISVNPNSVAETMLLKGIERMVNEPLTRHHFVYFDMQVQWRTGPNDPNEVTGYTLRSKLRGREFAGSVTVFDEKTRFSGDCKVVDRFSEHLPNEQIVREFLFVANTTGENEITSCDC